MWKAEKTPKFLYCLLHEPTSTSLSTPIIWGSEDPKYFFYLWWKCPLNNRKTLLCVCWLIFFNESQGSIVTEFPVVVNATSTLAPAASSSNLKLILTAVCVLLIFLLLFTIEKLWMLSLVGSRLIYLNCRLDVGKCFVTLLFVECNTTTQLSWLCCCWM